MSDDRLELDSLKKELTRQQKSLEMCRNQNKKIDEAKSKIISHLKNLMKRICEAPLHLLKPSTDKGTFVYTILERFDPGKLPCGQHGSIKERIADCKRSNREFEKLSSKGGTFSLVSRLNRTNESWRENKTGLVWHDVLNETLNSNEAMKACIERGLRLPTAEEYKEAEMNGFRDVVPNMQGRLFWSSSHVLLNPLFTLYFNGSRGAVSFETWSTEKHVRCVEE